MEGLNREGIPFVHLEFAFIFFWHILTVYTCLASKESWNRRYPLVKKSAICDNKGVGLAAPRKKGCHNCCCACLQIGRREKRKGQSAEKRYVILIAVYAVGFNASRYSFRPVSPFSLN